jgi:hypothetical protein
MAWVSEIVTWNVTRFPIEAPKVDWDCVEGACTRGEIDVWRHLIVIAAAMTEAAEFAEVAAAVAKKGVAKVPKQVAE